MLRAYRNAKAQAPEDQRALWSRIESSLDQGALGPPVEPAAAPSSPMWVVSAMVSMAVAAAVIAALSLVPGWRASRSVQGEPTAAPHGAVPVEPAAVQPGEPAAVSEASVAGHPGEPPRAEEGDPTVEPRRRVASPEPSRASARPSMAPSSTEAVDELQLELAMIRRAREALREQHPERALELLEAHAKAFPAGQMLEDRLVLRIEALCAAGKGPQGRAEIAAFLRDFPRSAHAVRVRQSCRQ
ncbi:hypothetical protein [Paraliomyxa miuraensis]|uniref:hypothetical protein n=1 Tax=Paraliomyxa miuraensis TaxID=376150 RepID=UPI002253632F|nr:hypothetical protein [Paraliomyxa miuraensis]MCX4239382.1 hypothetical protein [Paraliomyxa miuraensis]